MGLGSGLWIGYTALCTLPPAKSFIPANVIFCGYAKLLLAAKILLSGLNADVAGHELDLFKFAVGQMTQARAGAAEIMVRGFRSVTWKQTL